VLREPTRPESSHKTVQAARFSRFCTVHRRVSECPITLQWPSTFSPKMAPSLGASGPPSSTWYLWPTRVINPNGIWIGSAVFVWVQNAMLYNALLMGKKTPKISPSLWDCVTPPEEDRATAISNMRKKFGKDGARVSVCTDRQIHRVSERQTHRRGYYNTLPPLLRRSN